METADFEKKSHKMKVNKILDKKMSYWINVQDTRKKLKAQPFKPIG